MLTDLVMYHYTVCNRPLKEQLRAASLAGCKALATGPREYLTTLAQGITTRDMLSMADDAGLRLDHLDPFTRWLPRWQPGHPLGDIGEAVFNYDADDFFRMVDALGAKSATIVASFPQGANSLAELIDGFGTFCRRAARHDLRCDLEFIPCWGVPDLATAWNIVNAVNAPNSGILLDFWHYRRSHSEDSLLRSIPGRWITGVQFDDGTMEPVPGMNFLEETSSCRLPPGKGEMRVHEIVAILRETGGLNRCGPEIICTAYDSMTVDEIAAQCRASMAWALAE